VSRVSHGVLISTLTGRIGYPNVLRTSATRARRDAAADTDRICGRKNDDLQGPVPKPNTRNPWDSNDVDNAVAPSRIGYGPTTQRFETLDPRGNDICRETHGGRVLEVH